ncbi:hypothetical protein [Streptomyces sp. NPDC048663]|uniref:hypothetical protein n=1 Tax=Streptomyces sp. NPDC048663 TaxID=3155638 RepID=UPI003446776A
MAERGEHRRRRHRGGGHRRVGRHLLRLKGAVGCAELNVAPGAKGLHILSLDHDAPSVEAIERGVSPYPYREIEYAYTYGRPAADTPASSFLSYLVKGNGEDVIRTHGHVPCYTPVGMTLCG